MRLTGSVFGKHHKISLQGDISAIKWRSFRYSCAIWSHFPISYVKCISEVKLLVHVRISEISVH